MKKDKNPTKTMVRMVKAAGVTSRLTPEALDKGPEIGIPKNQINWIAPKISKSAVVMPKNTWRNSP